MLAVTPLTSQNATQIPASQFWKGDNDACPDTGILWLYGAAGSGKTSITRTIAEWCDEENRLLASFFFFFRSDSSRNSIKQFIPTLAYNTTQTIPGSRSTIGTSSLLRSSYFIEIVRNTVSASYSPTSF